MNRTNLAITLSLVSTLSLATPILAISDSVKVRVTQAQEKREDRQASREANLADRCETVFKRIDARINNYNVRKDNHIPVYKAALVRWQELSTKLASLGYDTTKLNTDLATLNTMILSAATSYQSFIDQLAALKDLDCVEARASFLTHLTTARTKLAEFRATAKQIHEFIRSTIKADLQALRQQKPTPTPKPTSSVTPEPTDSE